MAHPAAESLALLLEERRALEEIASSPSLPHRAVREAKGLLMAADGVANMRIAERLGVSRSTVLGWRAQFIEDGVDGVGRVRPGRGRKPTIPQAKIDEVVRDTQHTTPADATHWSVRSMAKHAGISKTKVQQIWSARGLKPHLAQADSDRRFRDADMGVITGGRRLVEEMAEWGPPHLWPQQLRYELAVRRAALDPVCFAQRREVERLVAEMVKREETFVGLDPERRERLQQSIEVLGLATMVKTQLDYTTTMILLDCEAAPFGLDRLALTSQTFADEMNALGTSLQAAIEGRRPKIIAPRAYRRSRATAPAVEHLLGEIGRVTDSLGDSRETMLVLSIGPAGELEAAVPVETDPPEDDPGDHAVE